MTSVAKASLQCVGEMEPTVNWGMPAVLPNKELYPVNVLLESGAALAGVKSIACGYAHSCAVLDDLSTYCWGYNSYGQLGNGSEKSSNVAAPVVDGNGQKISSDIVEVGNAFTCAIKSYNVQCWGANYYGQLGSGSTDLESLKPVSVALSEKALSITLGDDSACALDASGAVLCWGYGNSGQLGIDPERLSCNGDYQCSNVPIAVAFKNRSTECQLASGGWDVSVLGSTGTIYTVGYNGSGNLGNSDDSQTYSWEPKELSYAWPRPVAP
jgi:alpha-tubulin suppressor-like RCC1 family protein